MLFRLPDAANVIENPSADEAKDLAAKMPNARPTKYGNLNVQTEVVSRSKRSTYLVTDEPDGQNQSIPREDRLSSTLLQYTSISGSLLFVVGFYFIDFSVIISFARL